MTYQQIADSLVSRLRLDGPVIALAFVAEVPPDVPVFEAEVPSACTLWRKAESSVFYAPAEKHFNCPVGAMTMGFPLPDDVQKDLAGVVGKMCDCDYLSPTEAGEIPTVQGQKSGIVYGPLKDFPMEPDLVLMWLKPSQAMLFSEAVGGAAWTSASMSVLGRPACAALPAALAADRASFSLGCMGMRTFTEISEDRLLAAVPAGKVDEYLRSLESTVAANETMHAFYADHKAKFAG